MASVEGITITGVPGTISSLYWQVALNDGAEPPNYAVNHLDGQGGVVSTPMTISGLDSTVEFNEPVMLSRDPVEDLEAATKQYVDDNATGIPDAPAINWYYGRFNEAWAVIPIQSDAPSDGQAYVRQNNAWSLAFTGSGYLPLTGGTISGNLTVSGIMTVSGPNSLALNAPNGNQRAILGQTSGLTRWQLQLGDQTTEGAGNSGSNFSLSAYALTGTPLGTWLTIARSDGATVFNGSGVTIQGGLAVNGLLALASLNNLAIYGGSAGQVLTTNGSGILTWTTPSGGGGITDAPNDGTAYARKSAAWAHLTHTDITDWTATLAPYALTTAVPVASSTTPLMNGTAAVGTGTTYARADHVHPTDTHAIGDNRIINGDMRVDQRNNGASVTPTINQTYTLDRWLYGLTQPSKFSIRQAGPNAGTTALGFPYFLQITSITAFTPAATDTFYIAQKIEGDMVPDFLWGTANAQPVTLSFWANTTVAGTYSGTIANSNANVTDRSYPFTFALAGTGLQKVVVTIPGDTGGTWVLSGTGTGLSLRFDLGGGANFRGAAGSWQAGNLVGATGAVNICATNGAIVSFTGVKLEIGSVATPFNRHTQGKITADCLRYFQWLPFNMSFVAAAAGNGMAASVPFFGMRAPPTVSAIGADPNLTQTLTNVSSSGFDNITGAGARAFIAAAGAGNSVVAGYRASASAEI
jgi:hypothetical protein